MSEQQAQRKKPADFWGIPGSGLIAQSAGTFADEVGLTIDSYNAFTKKPPPIPEILTGPSMHPALDLVAGEAPIMPPPRNALTAGLEAQTEMLNAAHAAREGGLFAKALHWGAPILGLGAGAYGLYQGIDGLASGKGRTIDNVGSLISGVADTTAGVTGLAAAAGSTTGLSGSLAAAATPAGLVAAIAGLGVYGERESADVMQMDFWGDTINDAFKDEDGNKQSMYEAAWEAGGDMIDGAHDYMADTWLGEDVGGALGTIGGGLGAGATLVGATAANVGIGAVTAACDLGEGAYNLGKGALDLGGQGIDAVSDWWNSW